MERIYSPHLDEAVFYKKHKSGLDIYSLPKQGYTKSYAIFATKYGSTDIKFTDYKTGETVEIPDGVAHFLEHKLFEEPDGGNAFDRFSVTGASANAFTSFNMTAYLFSCTTDFYQNLETLVDFVQTPYFTDENIAKEQGIIGQEIRMYQDDPGWQAYFGTIEAMYNQNPVRRDIAGTVESIGTITKELLYSCYRNFYHPSNMVLVCVGDVDPDRVFETADKTLSPEFKALDKIERFSPLEKEEIFEKKVTKKLSVAVPLFYIGFKENGAKDEELVKNEIMNEIILECVLGQSSDLYRRLYDEGLINGEFGYETVNEPGYSHILAGGESPNPEKVYEIVVSELEKIAVNGIPKEDFERIKRVFFGDFIRSFNNPETIAHNMLGYLFKGSNLFDYTKIHSSITHEDCNARMKKIFREDMAVLSIVRSDA